MPADDSRASSTSSAPSCSFLRGGRRREPRGRSPPSPTCSPRGVPAPLAGPKVVGVGRPASRLGAMPPVLRPRSRSVHCANPPDPSTEHPPIRSAAAWRDPLNRWTVCRAWSAHLSARPVGHCLAATMGRHMGLRPAASRSAGTRSSMIQDRPRPARSTPTTQQPRQLHQHTTSNSRLYVLLGLLAERVGGRDADSNNLRGRGGLPFSPTGVSSPLKPC